MVINFFYVSYNITMHYNEYLLFHNYKLNYIDIINLYNKILFEHDIVFDILFILVLFLFKI